MNLLIGKIPVDFSFESDREHWNLVPTVGNSIAQHAVYGVGTAFIGGLTLLCAILFAGFSLNPQEIFNIEFLAGWAILALVLMVPHEILHCLAHPDRGFTGRTTIGFWPKKLIFYAHYDGVRSKGNVLFGTALPFVVLTVLPLAVAAIFSTDHRFWSYVAVINALNSGIDLVGFLTICYVIPSGSTIKFGGDRVYWKSLNLQAV